MIFISGIYGIKWFGLYGSFGERGISLEDFSENRPQNPGRTYQEIKDTYIRFIGNDLFDSGFMDQTIDEWYKTEDRAVGMIGYFTVIACMLAIMGILAMSTYFIQQRLKEIGLRRVNGAKVRDVLNMLIWGFLKWVILAFAIAVPITWYLINRWLATYPYHISQQVWVYLGEV